MPAHPSARHASVDRAALNSLRHLDDPRHRERTGLFRVEGVRNFLAAADAGVAFERLIVAPPLLQTAAAQMAVRRLTAAGVPRVKVTPEVFRSLMRLERACGIIAVARQRWRPLDGAPADPRRGLGWLLIEGIRAPGNLGTILRTAEAAGMNGAIFVEDDHGRLAADPFEPTVVRASMGGLFRLDLIRAGWPRTLAWLRARRVTLIGLSPDGAESWDRVPLEPPICLSLGEERRGLSAVIQAACDRSVRLPMRGRADSLNVAAAAAVMMYELVRRDPA